jgi:hypothetical protein
MKTKNKLGNDGGHYMAYNNIYEREKIYDVMTFDAFNVLVEKLTSFLKSKSLNPIRP